MIYRMTIYLLMLCLCGFWGCGSDSGSPREPEIDVSKQRFADTARPLSERLLAGQVLVDAKNGRAFLVAQYWTPQRGLVQALVDTLTQTQPDRAAQLLAGLMAAAGGETKLHFETRLIKLGDPAIEALVLLAEDNPDWQTAMRALDALGKLRARQGVETMRAHLIHSSDWVRMAAAHALGDVGGDEALSALVGALRDTSDTVVAAALVGLGKIGDQRAVRVCAEKLRHPNARVRGAAVSALARLGGGQVRALLEPMLEDPDEGVRFKAQRALDNWIDR